MIIHIYKPASLELQDNFESNDFSSDNINSNFSKRKKEQVNFAIVYVALAYKYTKLR